MPYIKQREQGGYDYSRWMPSDEGWTEVEENDARIQTALNPSKSYSEKRRDEYNKQGASVQVLVEKMWEHLIATGYASTEMETIETIRQQIKTSIPKE